MDRQSRSNPVRVLVSAACAIVAALTAIQCGSSSNNNPGGPTGTTTPSVASVSINPSTVQAGGTAQGTVTLSAGAPASGAAVALSSSNTGVATVPGSVSVAAGATSATFTLTAVGAGTSTITATLNGSQTAAVTVNAGSSTLVISLSASSVVGGNPVTGTVQLGSPAPAGGAVVSLSATDPVTVPANVTVPAGALSATFNVATRAVGGAFTVTITASFNGVNATTTLFVAPVTPTESLTSISLNPASVTGGQTSQGTATLDNAAPAGGAVVTLSSNNPAATVPGSITIGQGSTSGTFTVSTSSVSTATNVTITGSHGATRTATLAVNPAGPVARFTVNGPSGTDTCRLTNNGNSFDCTFDGSASTTTPGQTVIQWNWGYSVATVKNESPSGPTFVPSPGCGLIPSPPLPAGTTSFQMTVTLKVKDTLGLEASTTNSNVRVLPQGVCGF